MVYHGTEHVWYHSDTLVNDVNDAPYVEDAAVMVVMYGMRQMLWTRGLARVPYAKPKDYNFDVGLPTIELASYSAYMIPAGKMGSVDWLTEHGVFAHPEGEDAREPNHRFAWVFRAIKKEHAQWYENRAWPYTMLAPGIAEKLYGDVRRDVWG
jgi:hypothetical protein